MDSGGAGAPVRDRRGVTHRDHKRGLPPVRRDRNGEGCPGALRDRQTAIATSPTAPWPCRRTECLGKVHDDSLAKFAAARRPTTIAIFGSPSEFFPAHPWLRVEIRALVRFTEVQGFLCIDAGRLAGLPRLSEATNAAPTHCWSAVSIHCPCLPAPSRFSRSAILAS